MTRTIGDAWLEANRHYLRAALADVQAALVRHLDETTDRPLPAELSQLAEASRQQSQMSLDDLEALDSQPALELVCAAFGLSPFERGILLLCAGVELDALFGPLCAVAHDDAAATYPTFGLAMAVLPDPHWSALAPTGALRRWRLIELGEGHTLTRQPLRVAERLVHYLVGLPYRDDALLELAEPATRAEPDDAALAPSHRRLAEHVVAVWQHHAGNRPPAIELCGPDPASKQAIAAAACAACGLDLLAIRVAALPVDPAGLRAAIAAFDRQARLSDVALYLDCDALDGSESTRGAAVARLIEEAEGRVIVASQQRLLPTHRTVVAVDVEKPTADEQAALWRALLGAGHPAPDDSAARLAAQFNLGASTIVAIHAGATSDRPAEPDRPDAAPIRLADRVWDACRAYTRPDLDQLATRIEPRAGWPDLILPDQQVDTLRELCAQVRWRGTVYDAWGFAGRSERGLGISALFSGSSGTGKTMAAEVLANELRLDLYRVDLSATVSKYIGETEKNLRRIFDAADAGGAILLFDEADALFGKRSEVKDSHDRYANIEVSYLLQRFEAYRGLAILTTNLRDALDRAFTRRLRFVVEFPFPGQNDRARIWARVFPEAAPVGQLDLVQLAHLSVTGGSIRNIAMNAAFLAADAGESIGMPHLLRAARAELAKLERPLLEVELNNGAHALGRRARAGGSRT